jgi:hypothetical protein
MVRHLALIAAALAVASVGGACGKSGGGSAPLDARTLVAQPHDVGGLRTVGGSWNELGDDGSYPLSDALGGKLPRKHMAFEATYSGPAGNPAAGGVFALAVVLPDKVSARRLLRSTSGIEGFVGGAGVGVARAKPPGDADAALAGAAAVGTVMPGQVAVVAWTKGALYGYVSATGPTAKAMVARLAAAQETRFERALHGDHLAFDALLDPTTPAPAPFPAETGRTIHPAGAVPRIAGPGRYTLRDLGAGTLTFSPASGDDGIQFPVTLALPRSPRGRWLWRITTHVIVKLAAHAQLGSIAIYPHVAHSGGPGAGFLVIRDLSTGRTVLIEESKRTTTTASLEVRTTAMMGGNPSPRQQALFGFAVSYSGAKGALESVTVLPDSAIEVFDDPAKIGCCAITTSVSKALP